MKRQSILSFLLALALLFTACGPTATTAPADTPAPTNTALPPTPSGPAIGGTLVTVSREEPDTLDVQQSAMNVTRGIGELVGATLVAKDPNTNQVIPYLAESWTVSPDGLAWEFKLRQDVKFHDGTPLTAQVAAVSFQRALAISPVAPNLMFGVAAVEATDEVTLKFTMNIPNYVLLDNLSSSFLQPLPTDYIVAKGDDYGRMPIGAGPYKFKEWVTGEKIVLERNPDFTWGPAFTQGKPPYIEFIEYRFIAENATVVAGFETGEIDMAGVQTQDLERVKGLGTYQIVEIPWQGTGVWLHLNAGKAPLDDVKVRQALNYAVDRDSLIQIVLRGYGIPSAGPLQPKTYGYSSEVEALAYNFDLEKTKSLLTEAGYALNADGIYEKDGQPLKLRLLVASDSVQAAEVLQEMFKKAGVELEINQLELSAMIGQSLTGDYDLMLLAHVWDNSGILFGLFSSMTIGMLNYGFVSDSELDQMLGGIISATNEETFLGASAAAQKRITEQAYVVFLYAPTSFLALNNRVQGATVSPITGRISLYDAYLQP